LRRAGKAGLHVGRISTQLPVIGTGSVGSLCLPARQTAGDSGCVAAVLPDVRSMQINPSTEMVDQRVLWCPAMANEEKE